jgi:hypothetical protein
VTESTPWQWPFPLAGTSASVVAARSQTPEDASLARAVSRQFGLVGGVIVRRPSHYWGVVDGTPLGAVRPGLLWEDLVLSVVNGNEHPSALDRVGFQLALCCQWCGTLQLGSTHLPGLEWVDTLDELTSARGHEYAHYLNDCSACRGRPIPVPVEGSVPRCRPKNRHSYTAEVPGPRNSGDVQWCVTCGFRRISNLYNPYWGEGGAGGM